MRLALKGHSKFKVKIDQFDGRDAVIKSAPCADSYARLRAQIYKQSVAPVYFDSFAVPGVIAELPEDRAVVMDFIPYISVPEFFSLGNDTRWFNEQIADYFEFIFKTAQREQFDYNAFQEKAMAVMRTVAARRDVPRAFVAATTHATNKLLIQTTELKGAEDYFGWCHGDLTMSNLLVDPAAKKIYWFDFMDSWDHSPFIDFAKFNQELNYLWSLRFYGAPGIDATKYSRLLGSTYRTVAKRLKRHWNSRLINAYGAMNDLRLLQYERETIWFDRILRSVEALCS